MLRMKGGSPGEDSEMTSNDGTPHQSATLQEPVADAALEDGQAAYIGNETNNMHANAFSCCESDDDDSTVEEHRSLMGKGRRTLPLSQRKGCGTTDRHRIWFNADCCGLFCCVFTWSLIIFGTTTTWIRVLMPWDIAWSIKIVICTFLVLFGLLAIGSHLRAMFSNPGAVPFDAKPVSPKMAQRNCRKCQNFKPPRAHHCSVCERCIIKMDHHCPWINNCVGLANQKFFLLFVMYTALLSGLVVGTTIFRTFNCMGSKSGCGIHGGFAIASVLTTFIFAMLFGLFTTCMFFDQVHVICTNTPGIDRMKGHGEHDVNLRESLSEVFGGEPTDGFRLSWLLPTPFRYPDREALTGFTFRKVPEPKSWAQLEMV